MEGRKQMRLAVKLALVLCITSLAAVATPLFSVTFTGPDYSPNEASASSSFPTYEGSCPPLAISNCIIGDNTTAFTPVSATITQNSAGNWTYTETTYSPNSYGGFGAGAFGDALFYDTKNGTYWGISLDSLDGTVQGTTALVQGDLYYTGTVYGNSYLGPQAIGGADPVLINALNAGAGVPAVAGTPVTSGYSVTTLGCFTNANISENCSFQSVDPSGYAEYTITDHFTLNGSYAFLGDPDPFEFEVASYVCSNGVILGSSTGSTVPEPRGVVFIGAGLLLLAGFITKLRTKTA